MFDISPSRQMVKNYVQEKTVMPTRLKSPSRHCSSHHGRMQWGHERKTNWVVALGWGFPSGQPPTHTHTAPPNPAASLSVSLSLSLLGTSGCVWEVWMSAEGIQREVQAYSYLTSQIEFLLEQKVIVEIVFKSWVFILFAANLDSFRVSLTKSHI